MRDLLPRPDAHFAGHDAHVVVVDPGEHVGRQIEGWLEEVDEAKAAGIDVGIDELVRVDMRRRHHVRRATAQEIVENLFLCLQCSGEKKAIAAEEKADFGERVFL
ncbi:hypothetical protein ACFSKM_28050 [Ancylobacter dichloromethanicus]